MLVSGDLTSNIRRPNSKQETKERQTARPPIHVSSLNRSRSGGHFRSILGHHFGPEDPLELSSSLVSPHDYCLTPPPKRLTTLLRLRQANWLRRGAAAAARLSPVQRPSEQPTSPEQPPAPSFPPNPRPLPDNSRHAPNCTRTEMSSLTWSQFNIQVSTHNIGLPF